MNPTFLFDMEINRAFIEAFCRHTKILVDKGVFDGRDIKTANALRLVRKEIVKLERKINDDRNKSAANGGLEYPAKATEGNDS